MISQRYSDMLQAWLPPKRKVFVPPNENLVAELERRRRHRLLVKFLDRLDAEHGPVDESLIEKYIGFLE